MSTSKDVYNNDYNLCQISPLLSRVFAEISGFFEVVLWRRLLLAARLCLMRKSVAGQSLRVKRPALLLDVPQVPLSPQTYGLY